ncbi:MAG: beta-ketoacyl-ACP synthase II [Termitinemataceae bacterium]|nr:MAG: beta-ketoacyl-ACP synthase II [Termitinemataceae bacterium]
MKKVVITGMGAITPIGNNVEEFSAALKAGKCGIDHITQFDTAGSPVTIAGEVKNFDPSLWIDKKEARKMARFTQLAVCASAQAFKQADLLNSSNKIKCNAEKAGVVLGNGIGGFEVVSEGFRQLLSAGADRMPPLTVPMMISNEAAGNVSMVFGLLGPALTAVTACASGSDALGQALDLVRSGRCDIVVSGGTESCIVPFAVGGFCKLKTLSTKHDSEPQKASRPFDAGRDGFILGEGAGVLVLESEEHAKGRGANILAEFAGYGCSADAYHITSPDPSGQSGARAIRAALADANCKPEDIQYYNAHGTSTLINDATETKMLKIAFGDHAKKLKISSTKGMTGHCVAGAGGIEAVAAILAIREGFFPPTINYESPDPDCDLDYVPNKVQYGTINAAASGNLGFGGHNGVVVFKKY